MDKKNGFFTGKYGLFFCKKSTRQDGKNAEPPFLDFLFTFAYNIIELVWITIA